MKAFVVGKEDDQSKLLARSFRICLKEGQQH